MIQTVQTRFGFPHGNCLMACVSSITEISLDNLPDLFDETCWFDPETRKWRHDYKDRDWWTVLREALNRRGWDIMYRDVSNLSVYAARGMPQGWSIACGPSPRAKVVNSDGENAGHTVVCWNGGVVWDPHPSGDGLAGPVEDWIIMLPPLFFTPR
jgi:hypothetical protein